MNAQTMERVALPNPAIPIRTLLVASCQEDAQLLLSQLSSAGFSCDPTVVETCDGFRAALAQHDYDIILADYRLPGWNGLDALLELRAAHKDIPFLLVTGTRGEEAAVDCIKQGANDYILKDHLSRLPLAVKRALPEKATQDENHHAQAALLRSAARNRDLVEAALYGICRISEDGRFLDCNPALFEWWGARVPATCSSSTLDATSFDSLSSMPTSSPRAAKGVTCTVGNWNGAVAMARLSPWSFTRDYVPHPAAPGSWRSSPRTSPKCVPWNASCASLRNSKPLDSSPGVSRTISTTSSPPSWAGPSWASIRAATSPRWPNASAASGNKPSRRPP